ncbi:MAG: methyltransferase domain-containing protein [Kordiimonadaceae bacterium]|nr:methyltransferase domain-containing protein [Kordiimonadaceae bacterium]MBO6568955.1 methyltransferase domain-containing protein [Kordiimonadaceae bacterium]MBO6965070.1 methyltransferase domain-containing protein [Kordiimonadaceae bacterium]
MDNTPPKLFSPEAVARNRARAAKMDERFQFLQAEIADRMFERLQEINRSFEQKIDLGGRFSAFVPTKDGQAFDAPNFDGAVIAKIVDGADLIVSNLDLHWVNDLPGVLVQIKQALRPDGLMMVSMFGGETLHELRHSLLAAESEITGGVSQRIIPFADVKDLGSLLQRAGLALPVTDVDTLTLTYEHPVQLMQELRGMGEVNALIGRSKNFLRRDVLFRAAEIYQRDFSREDGRILATFEVMYLTGWHPHESQQKPLKPGSGKVSLADALKAGKPPAKD